MNEVRIPKGPFLANALHCGSEESEIGLYFPIPDALLIPVESWDVRRHEVAHRSFSQGGTGGSDFLAIRHLVGISHALCLHIFRLAEKNDLFIHGRQLGELHVSGQPSVCTIVEGLLCGVEEVERNIDMVWHSLVPIAEIAAIDFSEDLSPTSPSPYLWRSTNLSFEEREKVDEQKARLIQAAVAGYPPDFGGHHVTFGSFQEAVRQAWIAYNRIDDDITRKELLRLAMSSLSPVENQSSFQIIDPIKLILDNAAFAQQHAEEAQRAFFIKRSLRSRAVLTWLDLIVTQFYGGIDDALESALLTAELIREKIEDDPEKRGMPYSMTLGMYDVAHTGSGLWFSLLRFVWSADGGGVASINPVFLDVLDEMVPSDPSYPIRWLLNLLFREVLRQALKTGQPIICPFKGYKISSPNREEAFKCSASCRMRQLLELASRSTELVSDDALCEITTEAPQESNGEGLQRQAESPTMADTMIEAHKETPQMTDEEPLYCSFCRKSHDKVRRLIAGSQAYICNECVELCVQILKEGN
jgi:hypothetical protein